MQKRNQLPARHELKYFIHPAEVEALRARLRPVLKMDSHCRGGKPYVIRSLYFDDIDDSAYFDKQAGVMNRDKYRIRIYRYSDAEIFLERKRKLGDLIQKSSVQITRRLCEQIIAGDPRGLYKANNPLLKDAYVQMRTRLLRPSVIVDYEREAYLHPAQNVRITFDLKLRSGLSSFDLFNPHQCGVQRIGRNFSRSHLAEMCRQRANFFCRQRAGRDFIRGNRTRLN